MTSYILNKYKKTIYYTNCGHKIDTTYTFCNKCGHIVSETPLKKDVLNPFMIECNAQLAHDEEMSQYEEHNKD